MIFDKYIETIEQVQAEREQTMATLEFQQWMKELNVSQSYTDPAPMLNARDIMSQYDSKHYSKLNFKH